MPIETRCSSCQKRYRLSDKYAGKTIKCPGCQSVMKLPGAVASQATAAPPIAARPPAAAPPPLAKPPSAAAPPVAAAPPMPAAPGANSPSGNGSRPTYEPVLKATGKNKSMANMAVSGELKKLKRGNAITRSAIYQVGEKRSFWQRVQAGTHVGPFVKESAIRVDQLHLMTISDPGGEFHMIIPYDNGSFCPIEYLSVMPGRLPASLGLVRGRGGNWGIEASNSAAGVFLPQAIRSAMSAVGGQAEAVWVVLDEQQPQTYAEAANRAAALRSDLRFDDKLSMGPMEITYHLDWIAQAFPLNEQQYLLVAQYIPTRKMLGVGLGPSWFVPWRQQFASMGNQLPAGNGGMQCFDYGNWGTVAQEVLGINMI